MTGLQATCRFAMLAIAGLTLSACAEMPTRALSLDTPMLAPAPRVQAPAYAVTAVQVVVPEALTISERDGFFPTADIVWRGDAPGDRRAQIGALFTEAVARLQPQLDGPVPAVAVITVSRFHGVTEMTRDSVGGVEAIRFTLGFSDPVTGAMLAAPVALAVDVAVPRGLSAADERALVLRELTAALAQALG